MDIGKVAISIIEESLIPTIVTTNNSDYVEVTTNKTLAITDIDKIQKVTAAAVITIPLNAYVAFPINTEINILCYTASAVSIEPYTGVALLYDDVLSNRISGRLSKVTLKKTGTNEWVAFGGLDAIDYEDIIVESIDEDFTAYTEAEELPDYFSNNWAASSGKLAVVQATTGSDLLTNGNMEDGDPPTSWVANATATLASDADAHGGSKAMLMTNAGAGYGKCGQEIVSTVGKWYQAKSWVKKGTVSQIAVELRTGGLTLLSAYNTTSSSYVERVLSAKATTIAIQPMFLNNSSTLGATSFVDDVELKELDLKSLFSTANFSYSDAEIEVGVEYVKGGQIGVVMCLDDETDPQNFVIAYLSYPNDYKLVVDKCVGGVYTNLINTTVTYVAGQKIKLVKDGESFSAYYNDVQISTTKTVKDLPILSNKKHGLFSTSSLSKHLNLTVAEATTTASTYLTRFVWASDIHFGSSGYNKETMEARMNRLNNVPNTDFVMFSGDVLDSGYSETPTEMAEEYQMFSEVTSIIDKPLYPFMGNHDRDAESLGLLKHGVITQNGVTIIYFHADYVALSGAPEYDNTGSVTASELAWIEEQLIAAGSNIKILACHWSIVLDDEDNFKWPITNDYGRTEILALAAEYGVKLYLNGHEHNYAMPTGTAGVMTDVNGPNLGFGFMVVEVYSDHVTVGLHDSVSPYGFIETATISLV